MAKISNNKAKEEVAYPSGTFTVYAGPQPYMKDLYYSLGMFSDDECRRMLRFAFLDVLNAMPVLENGKKIKIAYDTITTVTLQQIVKTDWIHYGQAQMCLAIFLSDPRNIRAMAEMLPDAQRELWTRCVTEGCVPVTDAMEKLGAGLTMLSDKRYRLDAWLFISNIWCADRRFRLEKSTVSHFALKMPRLLRIFVVPALLPEEKRTVRSIAEVPEGLTVFGDERAFQLGLMRYETLTKSGIFDPDSVKPTAAQIKGLQSSMPLSEFFPEAAGDKLKGRARSRIVAAAIGMLHDVRGLHKMPAHDRCVALLGGISDYTRSFVRQALLPQLHGKFTNKDFDSRMKTRLKDILSQIPVCSKHGEWSEVKDFLRYMSLFLNDMYPIYGMNFSEIDNLAMYCDTGADGGGRRSADNKFTFDRNQDYLYVVEPLICSAFFMLAAFGLAEIAYSTEPDAGVGLLGADTGSPFACIRYWRLTELGRYAFGLVSEYKMKTSAEEASRYFRLDSRRLVVSVLADNAPLLGIVGLFAKEVASRRYLVTPESFLSDCSGESDIRSKINLIKENICPDPPAIWEEFFEKMIRNSAATIEEKGTFRVFRVDGNDPELRQIVTTDPEISKIAICAQGFRVLVRNNDVAKFKELMLIRGYLL